MHRPEMYVERQIGRLGRPVLTEGKLLYLGSLLGLTPSIRGGLDISAGSQPLAEAAEAIKAEPNFSADAEFIERELFVPEDRGV